MSQPNVTPAIACLLISHLPVKAERCRYPALRGRPLVIVEPGSRGDRVLDCSPEAEKVTPGMSLPDALDSCPSSILMQADTVHYSDVDDRIAGAVRSRFGAVEREGPGWFYVRLRADADETGAPLFGEAQLVASLLQAAPAGFEPRVGVAKGRFAAYAVAASTADGTAARAPADVGPFLRACAVDLLPLSREAKQRLGRLGFDRLGVLADSHLAEIHAVLGTDAGLALDLARGIDRRLHSGSPLAA